ncbi:MAG: replication-associated recombination protein A [Bacteroidales bacterium]|nr:replication-associated recombination protein A [Bacteroidales bacterium]MDY6002500.1 replication-associated recombination protein A [Candidatus Cryptobacteroides sp.]
MPPLAERMRPSSLDQYVGQRHLIGKGRILRNMIESGNLSSFILWGPPGVGKTTLARIIANSLSRDFYTLSAISSGVKDVRDVIDKAKSSSLFSNGTSPVLFIDEIHRFNKGQQDALLGAVENGTIVLIGATTENPSFEVITPLLSRCQVFVLKSLEVADLQQILDRAVKTDVLLKEKNIKVKETNALFRYSGGDGRKLLNILEIVIDSQSGNKQVLVDNKAVTASIQENSAIYDKDGEMHYDIISAFIKSIRGSDPNAAIYYLARMLDGGEDPLFIARRLCLSASEDVGLANPNALLLANACFQVVHEIGMPEARIPLAETTVYLASSPKSNTAYMALEKALGLVRQDHSGSVPLYLRNAPTKLMSELGYADGYKYAHDYPGHFVDLEFMPKSLEGTVFYEPAQNQHEDRLKAYLEACWPKYYKPE